MSGTFHATCTDGNQILTTLLNHYTLELPGLFDHQILTIILFSMEAAPKIVGS
jgi:hypothetical protein